MLKRKTMSNATIPRLFENIVKVVEPHANIEKFNGGYVIDLPRKLYLHGSSTYVRPTDDMFDVDADIVVSSPEVGEKLSEEFKKMGLKFTEFHFHSALLHTETHVHLEGKLSLTKLVSFLKLFRYF
jgi:hypothetical protein